MFPTPEMQVLWNQLYGKEVKSMVRIGRIVLDEKKVSSVVRANGTGNPLKTTVTMDNGTEHTFDKYAPEAWDYFKSRAAHVAGERFVQHN